MAAVSFGTQTPDIHGASMHPHTSAGLHGIAAAGSTAANAAAATVALDESTALMYAAERGAVRSIQAWMARGGDINATLIHQAGGSYTPLQLAAYTGHAIAVRSLLACGADASSTAASVSASRGGGPYGGTMGGAGAFSPPSAPVGHLPLHLCARYGHSAALEALLEGGVDPNALDEFSQTALHYAAAFGHLSCLTALCRYGADVYATEAGARSAADLATAAGHGQCATYLRRVMEAGGTLGMPSAAAMTGTGYRGGSATIQAATARMGHSGYDYGMQPAPLAPPPAQPVTAHASVGPGGGVSMVAAGPPQATPPSHMHITQIQSGGGGGTPRSTSQAGGGLAQTQGQSSTLPNGMPGVSFTMTGPGTVTLGLQDQGQGGTGKPGLQLSPSRADMSMHSPVPAAAGYGSMGMGSPGGMGMGMGMGGAGTGAGAYMGGGGMGGAGTGAGSPMGGTGYSLPYANYMGLQHLGGPAYPQLYPTMGLHGASSAGAPGMSGMGMGMGHHMGGMGGMDPSMTGMGGMSGMGMGGMGGGMGGFPGTFNPSSLVPPPPALPSIPPARARLRDWLLSIGASEYYPAFLRQGYDDIDFIHSSGGLTDADCNALGMVLSGHRKKVCSAYGLKPYTTAGIMERHAAAVQAHQAAVQQAAAQAHATQMALYQSFSAAAANAGAMAALSANAAANAAEAAAGGAGGKGGAKGGKGKADKEEEEEEEDSDDGDSDDDSEEDSDDDDDDSDDEDDSDEDGSDEEDSDEDDEDSDEE